MKWCWKGDSAQDVGLWEALETLCVFMSSDLVCAAWLAAYLSML